MILRSEHILYRGWIAHTRVRVVVVQLSVALRRYHGNHLQIYATFNYCYKRVIHMRSC